MIPRTVRVLLVLLAGLVVIWVAPTAAETEVGEDIGVASAEEARRRDAAAYAEGRGITVDEALRRFDVVPSLASAVQAAEIAAPGRFAGGWVEHDPELAVFVRFTGSEAGLEQATQALAGLAAPVHIEYGAPHTYTELRAGQHRITPTIHRDHPRMGLFVDVRTGSVMLLGPDPIATAELEALSRLAGVPVASQLSPPFQNVHTYGGKNIDAVEGCTTGFSVRDAISGETGVMTAGHCAGNNGSVATYYQDAATSYPMSQRGKRDDANQDFAWYAESFHYEYNRVWDGLYLREITSTKPRLEMVGGTVCHFGRGSGLSCGVVDDIHFDPGMGCNGPCDDVWVLIWDDPGLKCWFGDSGGPFFQGNTAWGTAKSSQLGSNPDDCGSMVFMSVGALNWDGVNTRLLLTPP
jgi:hypothetical protein